MRLAMPTLDVDLSDHALYAEGTPHAVFERLRRECPVYWNERRSGGPGFWAITKYADIEAIGKDPARFSSRKGVSLNEYDGGADLDSNLMQMDPPRHTAMRAVIHAAFTPKRMQNLEPVIRHHATRAIDDVIERGECDFQAVAATLPIRMICHLIGIPEDMHLQVLNWTNRTFGRDEYSTGPEDMFQAFQEIFQYALGLLAERAAEPKDDVATILAAGRVEDRPIDPMEQGWIFFLLLGAGNDTTRTLILNALRIFLDEREVFGRLRADPRLLPRAIEEVLRLEPSVRGMGRTATQDVTLRDTRIGEGDHVYLWYASGNRDEDVFPDPHRFDLDRPNASHHQSFGGGGPHFCIGAPLARLQSRILFEEVFRRMPDIEIAGKPVRARSDGFMNSLKQLPVRYSPGSRILSAAET